MEQKYRWAARSMSFTVNCTKKPSPKTLSQTIWTTNRLCAGRVRGPDRHLINTSHARMHALSGYLLVEVQPLFKPTLKGDTWTNQTWDSYIPGKSQHTKSCDKCDICLQTERESAHYKQWFYTTIIHLRCRRQQLKSMIWRRKTKDLNTNSLTSQTGILTLGLMALLVGELVSDFQKILVPSQNEIGKNLKS